MKKYILFLIFLLPVLVLSQETVGLVYDDENLSKSNGYTLFTSITDERVFLINNCGEVVNQWGSVTSSGNNGNSRMVYLLENGNLLVGGGRDVEIRDWDNNVLWGINYQDVLGFRIHHDIEPLPNGNFLALVRDVYSKSDLVALGLDPLFTDDSIQLERIVEIQPVGTDNATVVWEWKLVDHLIQDFDSTKPNYGVVANNPQLLDLNYDNGNGGNPIHANAIDHNQSLDQIAISSRHLSEVLIIDHSTTTAQAASHSGGLYGKGGDFLWRWGNPEVYDNGGPSDRKIGRQHDIQWIADGPHQGKLSLFSNDGYGQDLTASSVHIIDQNDTNGVYQMASGKYLPNDYLWSYDGTILGEVMFGSSRCGVQIMSNGNALINETARGRLTEVDNLGNVVWVYIIPSANNTNFQQFEIPSGNGSFRALRYPDNYPAFAGRSFNNSGIIENENSISQDCTNRLSVGSYSIGDEVSLYPNPANDIIHIDTPRNDISKILFYDITGKIVLETNATNTLDISYFDAGIYIVKINTNTNQQTLKLVKN